MLSNLVNSEHIFRSKGLKNKSTKNGGLKTAIQYNIT